MSLRSLSTKIILEQGALLKEMMHTIRGPQNDAYQYLYGNLDRVQDPQERLNVLRAWVRRSGQNDAWLYRSILTLPDVTIAAQFVGELIGRRIISYSVEELMLLNKICGGMRDVTQYWSLQEKLRTQIRHIARWHSYEEIRMSYSNDTIIDD